jgi:signal transduction histidine kinase
MAALIRTHDWPASSLGPIKRWPQSLRTAVDIMLNSRYAMFVWWGPELINLYNDAYRPFLGGKHPRSLGRSAREVWSEIWQLIGPRADAVLNRAESTFDEALLLIMERFGYPEETYFTFSYSPIRSDSGEVGGLFCAVTDDTRRVIGERRLRLLREVAARVSETHSPEEVCAAAAACIARSTRDLPFALLYLNERDEKSSRLVAQVGMVPEAPGAEARVDLERPTSIWPFARAARENRAVMVEDLAAHIEDLPQGAWDRPPTRGVVLPLKEHGRDVYAGFLIVGLNPYLPFDEEFQGFVGLLADQITGNIARARAYQEERRRAEALAEIDRAKTVFFSNISHEFRTPLTLMLGPLEDTLANPTMGTALRGPLELAHRNARRLLKLVNSLLDFSRIEAGRVQASYEPTDLAGLTRDLASTFRSAIERAGLELRVDADPVGEPVYLDREMWEKIVLNLISNAFKFTLQGSVTVRVRRVASEALLEVTDSGVGIAPDQLPRIFERFYRVSNVEARTQEGSGIGLALVQELVKLHGGVIEVESAVGRGTTFRVKLPFGAAHVPPERLRAPRALASTATDAQAYVEEALRWLPEDQSGLLGRASGSAEPASAALDPRLQATSGARILLAEDNADMRQYVAQLLRPHYQVVAVTDGQSALDAAREQRPDLVLSDIMMPRLDGLGLLKALRSDVVTASIPVIFLSARAGEEATVEGFDAGVDDYLVKPFSARELLARIGGALTLARVRLRAEEALREADRQKDEFLAMLAHELRTPLAPIRNSTELLNRMTLSDSQAHSVVDVLRRQVSHLARLVDDLLDVQRITQGRIELNLKNLDLGAVIAQAVETVESLIREKHHDLQILSSYRALHVDGDSARLVQCLVNLLTNAAKYTDAGGRILIHSREEGSEAVIEVTDNGAGIAPTLLPRIFDLFVQSDRTLDRSQGGLGIGLSVVQRLIEMHGGKVSARSEGPGRGSTFTIRLPLAEMARGIERTADPAIIPPWRILVVDDNADAADTLKMMLELEGHDVKSVYSGRDALECLASFNPELVLLDIGLPVMSGYEVARQIQQQNFNGRVPKLIALTGYGQAEDRNRALLAGFDEHLVKPLDFDRLTRALSNLRQPRQ